MTVAPCLAPNWLAVATMSPWTLRYDQTMPPARVVSSAPPGQGVGALLNGVGGVRVVDSGASPRPVEP